MLVTWRWEQKERGPSNKTENLLLFRPIQRVFFHCTTNKSSEFMRIHQSQNHRKLGVGRDLCGSSSPRTLPKQGHAGLAAQDLMQAGLEYPQRRRPHNLPKQPVPLVCHPQNEEVLPHVQRELPVLQFVMNEPRNHGLWAGWQWEHA